MYKNTFEVQIPKLHNAQLHYYIFLIKLVISFKE